jgi:hypothetical protein
LPASFENSVVAAGDGKCYEAGKTASAGYGLNFQWRTFAIVENHGLIPIVATESLFICPIRMTDNHCYFTGGKGIGIKWSDKNVAFRHVEKRYDK